MKNYPNKLLLLWTLLRPLSPYYIVGYKMGCSWRESSHSLEVENELGRIRLNVVKQDLKTWVRSNRSNQQTVLTIYQNRGCTVTVRRQDWAKVGRYLVSYPESTWTNHDWFRITILDSTCRVLGDDMDHAACQRKQGRPLIFSRRIQQMTSGHVA